MWSASSPPPPPAHPHPAPHPNPPMLCLYQLYKLRDHSAMSAGGSSGYRGSATGLSNRTSYRKSQSRLEPEKLRAKKRRSRLNLTPLPNKQAIDALLPLCHAGTQTVVLSRLRFLCTPILPMPGACHFVYPLCLQPSRAKHARKCDGQE